MAKRLMTKTEYEKSVEDSAIKTMRRHPDVYGEAIDYVFLKQWTCDLLKHRPYEHYIAIQSQQKLQKTKAD